MTTQMFVEGLRGWDVTESALNEHEKFIFNTFITLSVNQFTTLENGWDLNIYRSSYGTSDIRFYIQYNLLSGKSRVTVLFSKEKKDEARLLYNTYKLTPMYKLDFSKVCEKTRKVKAE